MMFAVLQCSEFILTCIIMHQNFEENKFQIVLVSTRKPTFEYFIQG